MDHNPLPGLEEFTSEAALVKLPPEQIFERGMSLLANSGISKESAHIVLDTIFSAYEAVLSEPEIADLVSYQLMNKWGPESFSAASLEAIVERLDYHGAVDHIAELKHLQRKAQKKLGNQ